MYQQMTDDQRAIYRIGGEDALKFRADPYRDLYQDVFKAETAAYKLWVGWSDPEGVAYLKVQFKERAREIEMEFASAGEAVHRAIRFVAEHPAPMPWCGVDY